MQLIFCDSSSLIELNDPFSMKNAEKMFFLLQKEIGIPGVLISVCVSVGA